MARAWLSTPKASASSVAVSQAWRLSTMSGWTAALKLAMSAATLAELESLHPDAAERG